MIRRIIHIDEDKCNGCGACAAACHEGAIAIINGKARLTRDDYCDGMGDCLPQCPLGAITFEEREAAAYDEKAVAENKSRRSAQNSSGCTVSRPRSIERHGEVTECTAGDSALRNWPVQIKLAPIYAPYFDGAGLLIAADCTAYAFASMHREYMSGRVTLIGCPKLDAVDYGEKLAEIIGGNEIEDITVVRMEVPCCRGIEMAVRRALERSGKDIPLRVVVVSTDGRIVG